MGRRLLIWSGAAAVVYLAIVLLMNNPEALADESALDQVLEEHAADPNPPKARGFFGKLIDDAIARSNEEAAERQMELEDMAVALDERENALEREELAFKEKQRKLDSVNVELVQCVNTAMMGVQNVESLPES